MTDCMQFGQHEICWEDNEVGGRRYWCDHIGDGVIIWDTAITPEDILLAAIAKERELNQTVFLGE
jgi:hypothetical protein